MAIIYRKTFKPVHLNIEAKLLGRLDEFRSSDLSRTKLIHNAIEQYVDKLEEAESEGVSWRDLFRKRAAK